MLELVGCCLCYDSICVCVCVRIKLNPKFKLAVALVDCISE